MQAVTTAPNHPKESTKETIISVIIAFALAFVFRSFVAEAFIIPTGSMAPTLNGAHMRFVSPDTGRDWAVSPWVFAGGDTQAPYPEQARALRQLGVNTDPVITVHDPSTGNVLRDDVGATRAGDRIFVLKFLYNLVEPDPFDVVVFKNVTQPEVNYIKRLIGLPKEQVALVDGDVFVRPTPAVMEPNPWAGAGWTIRRKPRAAQEAVWQVVYDASETVTGAASPWTAESGATARENGRVFSVGAWGGGGGSITWNNAAKFATPVNIPGGDAAYGSEDATRAITDRYAYNEHPYYPRSITKVRYPVSDLRVRAGLRFDVPSIPDSTSVSFIIEARGQEFVARITGRSVTLEMGPKGGPRTTLGSGTLPGLSSGFIDVAFAHSDQSLQFFANNTLVASGVYDWSPMERLSHSLTPEGMKTFTDDLASPAPVANVLARPAFYTAPGVRVNVSGTGGGAVEVHRLGLDRDLFYRPDLHSPDVHMANQVRDLAGRPAAATHPRSTLTLQADQFFVCGDNSPASLDARLWGYPSAWVADELDPSPSIVPRRLLLGKAFLVYFPAPGGGNRPGPVPVPDFGRLRFIR